ncbi:hypothetical protein GE061_004076 [Apolygus lucorum]|uniref:Uncharacterized protein n=1 Tax=Apolygus lucorum TaxID=248454 RepID=A0A8S9WY64_APOLU|nr:hypothetical protein GE061_004076 [Apolygus lucorum]
MPKPQTRRDRLPIFLPPVSRSLTRPPNMTPSIVVLLLAIKSCSPLTCYQCAHPKVFTRYKHFVEIVASRNFSDCPGEVVDCKATDYCCITLSWNSNRDLRMKMCSQYTCRDNLATIDYQRRIRSDFQCSGCSEDECNSGAVDLRISKSSFFANLMMTIMMIFLLSSLQL